VGAVGDRRKSPWGAPTLATIDCENFVISGVFYAFCGVVWAFNNELARVFEKIFMMSIY
jgi:hypothetical protein